jgi:hypothetical protein
MRSALLSLALLAGCAASTAAPTAAPAGQLVHTVFFWFKAEAPGDTAARLLDFYRTEVPGLPGVLAVYPGVPEPSDRPVVDSSFQLGVSTVFADAAAERVWQDHPVHRRMIAAFEPWIAKVAVYDTRVAASTRP